MKWAFCGKCKSHSVNALSHSFYDKVEICMTSKWSCNTSSIWTVWILFPKRISMGGFSTLLLCQEWPRLMCTVTPLHATCTRLLTWECTLLYKSRSADFASVFKIGETRQKKKMSSMKVLISLLAVAVPQRLFQPLLSWLERCWHKVCTPFPSHTNVLWNYLPLASISGNSQQAHTSWKVFSK